MKIILPIIAAVILLLTFKSFQGTPAGDELLHAVEAGDQTKVHSLLVKKVDANSHDRRGNAALYFAAYRGYTAIAKDLLDHGANINASGDSKDTALHGAAMAGQKEVAELLLARGAEVNLVSADGWTPLREASYSGAPNPEVISLLIAHGAKM
ncbi:MAG: ankyrin repeat domain-containing protein [Gallionella sp.]|nr:ankyrin repeat domain-containing protein [Gallionella sp.]